MKIVVAISGASGANLGLKLLKAIPDSNEKHLVATDHAKIVLDKEENIVLHKNNEIWASIASGSFKVDVMFIVPCSMNTLAKISVGIADNLITRAASVMIKEQKKLILAPRELPFSPIALENMLKLSRLGVVISPPILGYYAKSNSLEDVENFIIGKWLDSANIENNLYERWK